MKIKFPYITYIYILLVVLISEPLLAQNHVNDSLRIEAIKTEFVPMNEDEISDLMGIVQEAIDSKSKKRRKSEKLTSIIDLLSVEKEHSFVSFYPMLGYDSQTGLYFGVKPLVILFSEGGLSSTISSRIAYYSSGMVEAMVSTELFTESGWNVEGVVEYQHRTDNWYGIGVDRSYINANYSEISQELFVLKGNLLRKFGDFYGGVSLDVKYNGSSSSDSILFNPSVPGYGESWSVGVGPRVKMDTRDSSVYPTKGFLGDVTLSIHDKLLGSEFNYSQLSVDLKYFRSIISPNTVLGFHNRWVISSVGVPYFKMPILSDKYNLRGINNQYRYLDKSLWYAQSEIRQKVYGRVGAVAWVGAGRPFGDASSMFKSVNVVWGVGGRIQINDKEKINLRVDAGFGPNGDSSLFFTFLEAF